MRQADTQSPKLTVANVELDLAATKPKARKKTLIHRWSMRLTTKSLMEKWDRLGPVNPEQPHKPQRIWC
jgi:hypothetical protein